LDVFSAVIWLGQKVENGSVMPNIKPSNALCLGDIVHDPLNLPCLPTKSSLAPFQRRRRNVKNSKSLDSLRHEAIYQGRCAATHINH